MIKDIRNFTSTAAALDYLVPLLIILRERYGFRFPYPYAESYAVKTNTGIDYFLVPSVTYLGALKKYLVVADLPTTNGVKWRYLDIPSNLHSEIKAFCLLSNINLD